MKKYFLFSIVFVLGFTSCNFESKEKEGEQKKEVNESLQLYKEIAEMEQELFSHLEPDRELALEMIGKYIHYVDKFPEDTASAEFLFRAAEIAMNFGQPNNAVNYLTRIENNYEDYIKYGTSLFLKAHIYNYYLQNNTKAEEYYKKFIEMFPNHALVEDANSALMFLDMDDAQLIEFFEQMNV